MHQGTHLQRIFGPVIALVIPGYVSVCVSRGDTTATLQNQAFVSTINILQNRAISITLYYKSGPCLGGQTRRLQPRNDFGASFPPPKLR